MIDVSDENVPRCSLLLEMAFQTERGVAFVEQSLIDGTVRRMADHTTLTQCLVLINPRAPLLGVALKASFVSAQESKAASFQRLLNIRAAAFNGDSLMRVVTIGTTHFAFEHRMVMRQRKRCAHFQVTLETGLRIFPRIDDRVRRAATLDVQASRPMARLASHVLGVFSFGHQSRVRRGAKVAHDFFMAGPAFLRTNELRAGNAGWRKNRSTRRAARKQNDGQRCCSPDAPQNFLALTADPSS